MINNSCFLSQSVLGALIAVNLKNTLLQLSDPYYLWKKSKLDCVSQSDALNVILQRNMLYFCPDFFLFLPQCVWVVSFLATFFLSLPYGVAIGVGFSILVVIFKTQL